jgi:beta-glucosidase
LAGRNFEAYSEDPFLAGRIGAAWIKGVQSQGIGASLKHFACNNQEFERFRGSSQVDERTLREIYLPAFEYIVKETSPWTVMCAYNRINGIYASQHQTLLTEILRDEWGFDGLVVSDWSATHSTIEALRAGLDLEMPGPAKHFGQLLVEAVLYWQLDERSVDQAARRMLQLLERCGKLTSTQPEKPGSANTPAHQQLARKLAEEAMALLKNEAHILPLDLKKIKTLAVIGPNAAEVRLGGGGSAYVDPPYRVSPLEGLKARLEPGVQIRYAAGCENYVEPPVLPAGYLLAGEKDQHGLLGEYFDNAVWAGEPKLTRVDEGIEFRWSHNPPGEGIPRERFSVRWSGKLVVPAGGRFVLSLMNSSIARLFLDGDLLLEHTTPEKLVHDLQDLLVTAEVELEAGKEYALRLEFSKPSDVRTTIVKLGLTQALAAQRAMVMQAVKLAAECDAVILCAGLPERYETEGRDRLNWELPGLQTELIEAVAKVNRNTAVVLNCGAPVAMPWIEHVPAVLNAFYPGQEGGNALAALLVGDINPSGKLPYSIPKAFADNPTFLNYPGRQDVLYGEGIYVGYRYYDAVKCEPLFPFGHGLSYTTFDYSGLNLPVQTRIGEAVHISCEVTNSGKRAGKETVQVYVHDLMSSLPRPPQELKAFCKVSLLPGETQAIEFSLDERAFSFYDPDQHAWVCEPGRFEIRIGSSSRDIRLVGTVNLSSGMV